MCFSVRGLASEHEDALDAQILVNLGPVERRELLEVRDQLLFTLPMDHNLHGSASQRRWLPLAPSLQPLPLFSEEAEALKVVQIVDARIQTAVNDEPIAQDCSTVVPSTRFDSVEILRTNFLPPVRV